MDRTEVNRRTSPASHIGTAEMSLAMWLRNGRAQKNLSLEDVARITKIQPRILERLEAGKLDGLPADVFVRGFVRSFAKCVGLDEQEALRRYGACSPLAKSGTTAARAVVEAMGDLAPNARGNAPKVLRDDTAGPQLAAGSMEIAPSSFDAVDNEPSVIIELVEPSEIVDDVAAIEAEPAIAMMPIPAAESIAVAIETSAEPVVNVDAVVAAPPPDVDLSAEIALPTEKPKAKSRSKKAADPNAPKASRGRRSKVANGTPSEPTPVIAAEIAAEASEIADAVATPAPKRRRKAKGSIVPPMQQDAQPEIASAVELTPIAVDAPLEVAAELAAPIATPPETPTELSAADEMFAPISDAQRAAEASDPPTPMPMPIEDEPFATAIEFASISVPAQHALDSADAFDSETTRFEREDEIISTPAWTPRMPPFAAASNSWRRAAAAPALVAVIDDADPDGAERALEDRRQRTSRRTFLPPILLDREGDRSARQGGLTLAVIILLIAATLTLSYLMRRPSSAGDGVTQHDTTTDTFVG
jgi:hypothetical protein